MCTAVDFMGLPLKNPVIVAAGPWSRDAASIQKAIDAGAAAVVTETITLEKSQLLRPRIYRQEGRLLNTTLYSTLSFEQLERELSQVRKGDSFLICNIRGGTPSELAYTATAVERFGADALELCCFTPIGTKMENLAIHPDEIYEMIRQVTQKVSVPVMVRLPHHAASSREFVQAVERAGAKAVSAIETLSGLIGVDVERGRSRTPTIGGYSGPHIRPVSLAATAMLSQLADCQIASMGGVEDALSALEFLMLGASVVQLGSAVLLGGYGRITRTVEDLEAWMRVHRYGSVEELRGIALDSLSPFEEILTRRLHASLDSPCGQSCGEGGCPCVTACLDGAVVREGDRVRVVRERCSGCGLCVSLCPGGHFSLRK
ncbi:MULTISPECIES: 4Fe-4S binding protein [Anaerotruncus]|uniref:4Fe-4S binding protein n=1 Tax=Anaerotruncus TaxID=244127 RepID=UPI002086AE0C|nr:4Fe-4S binding protein [Anaerotruncus massiliensis (ex Togo et al. 2019)]GKH46299.1 dihydropyrimidine dehydrogenase [Oscillospiraceae bacterium]